MKKLLTGLLVGMLTVPFVIEAQQKAAPQKPVARPPVSGTQLHAGIIKTRHIVSGGVTAAKLAIKVHAVTVGTGTSSASSTADPGSIGGTILGIYPTGNQDQLVDNVALNGSGQITVTLAANATANNTFNVLVAQTVGVER